MKKPLLFTVTSLVFLVMVTSVMAKPIGPRGRAAEKNQNLEITPEGEVELVLPSGVGHIWMDTDWGAMDASHWKNASEFEIKEATGLTVGDLANIMFVGDLAYENTWTYVSLGALVGLIDLMVEMELISEAEGEQAKNEFTSWFPEGMYLMFVNVGE